MTVVEMAARIGQRVLIVAGIGGIRFAAVIEDVKLSYGQERVLVRPVDGSGSAWVDVSRIEKYGD